MLIIPAIDIKNGNCVRLLQGDPEKETVYGTDPVEMAKRIEGLGAGLIHVVDLDGAFEGTTVNCEIVKRIASSVNIPIEIGGGIRNTDDVKRYLDAGINRIIVGTVVLEDAFQDLIDSFSENLVAGIDARDSMVATHGWKNVSETRAIDFIRELKKKGLREFIYTDISTDGMLTGPNYKAIEDILADSGKISLVASGGVSSIDDIRKLSSYTEQGLKGCITGKAFYEGKIDLKKAFSEFAQK